MHAVTAIEIHNDFPSGTVVRLRGCRKEYEEHVIIGWTGLRYCRARCVADGRVTTIKIGEFDRA